jgi:bacterioferritin-associated ferredoxin
LHTTVAVENESRYHSDAWTETMIVCSCFGVSHKEIDAHVARGCRTVRELGRACGAGTDCGSCVADLKARIARAAGPSGPSDDVRPVPLELAAK